MMKWAAGVFYLALAGELLWDAYRHVPTDPIALTIAALACIYTAVGTMLEVRPPRSRP